MPDRRKVPDTRSETSSRLLSCILLSDLSDPHGLVPLFGLSERDAMVTERLRAERRHAGERLQNIEALIACIAGNYDEYDRGEISKEVLLETVWSTIQLIDSQTRYDEAAIQNHEP